MSVLFLNFFFKFQVPLMPRVRHVSEGSTVSVKEDEEESSDEEDKKSSQNTAQREKVGDMKECTGGGRDLLLPSFPSQG